MKTSNMILYGHEHTPSSSQVTDYYEVRLLMNLRVAHYTFLNQVVRELRLLIPLYWIWALLNVLYAHLIIVKLVFYEEGKTVNLNQKGKWMNSVIIQIS